MNKKTIAKEWLLFLKWFLFGLLVMPVSSITVTSIIYGNNYFSEIDDAYLSLFGLYLTGSEVILIWLFVLAPYFVSLLVRSIRWSKSQL